jgi:hypothetical protein
MYKIPEVQKQYAKIKGELEAIDYKNAKYELENINNQSRVRAQKNMRKSKISNELF